MSNEMMNEASYDASVKRLHEIFDEQAKLEGGDGAAARAMLVFMPVFTRFFATERERGTEPVHLCFAFEQAFTNMVTSMIASMEFEESIPQVEIAHAFLTQLLVRVAERLASPPGEAERSIIDFHTGAGRA